MKGVASDDRESFAMQTCPHYQDVGDKTCRNGCREEPACITNGPWDAVTGWTDDELRAHAQHRNDTERKPA